MSTFALKIIAAITMFFDHVAYFFQETPVAFHWAGRISAPIFLFCTVNGILNTKTKKSYCLRLYISSLIMAVIQAICHIQLNFLRTLFIVSIILCIVEHGKNEKASLKKYIAAYVLYQIITCFICGCLIQAGDAMPEGFFTYVMPAILGSIFAVNGGLIYILIGIVFYAFYNKPTQMIMSYGSLSILYTFLMTTPYISSMLYLIGRINHMVGSMLSDSYEYIIVAIFDMDVTSMGGNIIFDNYQWMMVFALYPILKYDGNRGAKIKYSFYLFYPLHIVLLWAIS